MFDDMFVSTDIPGQSGTLTQVNVLYGRFTSCCLSLINLYCNPTILQLLIISRLLSNPVPSEIPDYSNSLLLHKVLGKDI